MSRWLALGAGIVLVSAMPRTLHAPNTMTPRLAVIPPPEPSTWLLGARLGIEEAGETARLLRRDIHLVELASDPAPAAVVTHEARTGTVVVLAAGDGEDWSALEEEAASSGLVLLDARPTHPADAPCRAGVFRIGVTAEGSAGNVAALWHESLTDHGAAELNQRFRQRFGLGMDAAAWAGWFAVKVATAALLGVQDADARTIAGFLTSRAASFDGHKGPPLRFRASDRRLAQPAYVAGPSGALIEVEPAAPASCHRPASPAEPSNLERSQPATPR